MKFILAKEDVVHLDDLILRRTMLGKLGNVTSNGLQEIAQVCKDGLGWTDRETKAEMERFTEILRDKHMMYFNTFVGG